MSAGVDSSIPEIKLSSGGVVVRAGVAAEVALGNCRVEIAIARTRI